jgi:hypothetical protein
VDDERFREGKKGGFGINRDPGSNSKNRLLNIPSNFLNSGVFMQQPAAQIGSHARLSCKPAHIFQVPD